MKYVINGAMLGQAINLAHKELFDVAKYEAERQNEYSKDLGVYKQIPPVDLDQLKEYSKRYYDVLEAIYKEIDGERNKPTMFPKGELQ